MAGCPGLTFVLLIRKTKKSFVFQYDYFQFVILYNFTHVIDYIFGEFAKGEGLL